MYCIPCLLEDVRQDNVKSERRYWVAGPIQTFLRCAQKSFISICKRDAPTKRRSERIERNKVSEAAERKDRSIEGGGRERKG